MSDDRTRIEKLQAMAADESSPAEAELAAARLRTMGAPVKPPPPRPPAPPISPFPDPGFGFEAYAYTTMTGATVTSWGNLYIRFDVPSPFADEGDP